MFVLCVVAVTGFWLWHSVNGQLHCVFRLAGAEPLPVAKVAGLKKLRTLTGDRQALGAEVSFLGVRTGRLVLLLLVKGRLGSQEKKIVLSCV